MLGGSAPSRRGPASRPSVIAPARPQLRARASWGREGPRRCERSNSGAVAGKRGGPQMPAGTWGGCVSQGPQGGKRCVCAREPAGERGGRAARRGVEMRGGQSNLLRLARGPLGPADVGQQPLPVVSSASARPGRQRNPNSTHWGTVEPGILGPLFVHAEAENRDAGFLAAARGTCERSLGLVTPSSQFGVFTLGSLLEGMEVWVGCGTQVESV